MLAPDTDGIREQRIARATQFFDVDLEGQQEWYSDKATRNKRRYFRLSVIVLAAGAATSVVQIFVPSQPDHLVHPTTIITVALGAIVVIAKGLDALCSPEDNWRTYRQAAEKMKRERRLYTNAADAYATIADEDGAYRTFVERVEAVLGEEQNIYWQSDKETAPATDEEATSEA